MAIQTVFKAGNSNVVAVPRNLSEKSHIKSGDRVNVTEEEGGIMIKKIETKKKVMTKADKDFQKWLDVFMEENGEILDELAIR